jgi:hypothetical protein
MCAGDDGFCHPFYIVINWLLEEVLAKVLLMLKQFFLKRVGGIM